MRHLTPLELLPGLRRWSIILFLLSRLIDLVIELVGFLLYRIADNRRSLRRRFFNVRLRFLLEFFRNLGILFAIRLLESCSEFIVIFYAVNCHLDLRPFMNLKETLL